MLSCNRSLELQQQERHRSSLERLEPSKKRDGSCTWPRDQREPLDEQPLELHRSSLQPLELHHSS